MFYVEVKSIAFLKIASGVFINILAALILGFFTIRNVFILIENLFFTIILLVISLKIEEIIINYD